jgi:hypothetical protein
MHFDAVCFGNPIASVTSSMNQDATLSLSNTTIAYTYSKMKTQGTLTDAFETVLDYGKSDGEVIPITGDNGLKFKVLVIHAFAQNYQESAAQAYKEGTAVLPKLMILPATFAANCGVSSKDCHWYYCIGFSS